MLADCVARCRLSRFSSRWLTLLPPLRTRQARRGGLQQIHLAAVLDPEKTRERGKSTIDPTPSWVAIFMAPPANSPRPRRFSWTTSADPVEVQAGGGATATTRTPETGPKNPSRSMAGRGRGRATSGWSRAASRRTRCRANPHPNQRQNPNLDPPRAPYPPLDCEIRDPGGENLMDLDPGSWEYFESRWGQEGYRSIELKGTTVAADPSTRHP